MIPPPVFSYYFIVYFTSEVVLYLTGYSLLYFILRLHFTGHQEGHRGRKNAGNARHGGVVINYARADTGGAAGAEARNGGGYYRGDDEHGRSDCGAG